MLRTILLGLSILCLATVSVAQADTIVKPKIYNPDDNAAKAVAQAIATAKKENKHVFIQVGGNWCIWCIRFNNFVKTDATLDSLVKANYVVYHLNYSEENYNKDILKQYKFPQRFGFPVFLILDQEGKLLHTQNTEYLEDGKSGYDKKKVLTFLNHWSPKALNPATYQEKK